MILDKGVTFIGDIDVRNVLVPALVTAIGTTTGATTGFNVVDANPSLGAANVSDFGTIDVAVQVQVMQTLTSAGAAFVCFQIVQADDANLTTNVQVLSQTDAIVHTVLTAGTRIPLSARCAAPMVPKRYVGMRIVIAGAALTNSTGQFFAAVAGNSHNTGLDGRGQFYKNSYPQPA